MTEESKTILIKRLKSFGWRLAGMLAVAILDFASANIGLFNLPNEMTVVIGLIVGELTKYLNTRHVAA